MQYLEKIKYIGINQWGKKISLYHCKRCGKDVEILDTYVRTNKKVDCGCGKYERLRIGQLKNKTIKHGMSNTAEYQAWKGMKARCYKTSYQHYDRYGGRGIKVCDEWKNDFLAFYRDMGKKPTPQHQLDRIDNNGDYCKDNCRWSTPSQNCYNRSRYHNKTKFTGVSENTSKKGRYSAWFSVNRKHIQVGTYDSPEEAYKERIKAMKRYNKEHNVSLEFVEYEDFIKDIV
jgi:hypothetical protein